VSECPYRDTDAHCSLDSVDECSDAGHSTYTLELVPIESKKWRDVPISIRLRKALKALSRAYGLRVTKITPCATLAEATDPEEAQP
jgi:glucose-6-phosphate 1-dehydrogenase